MFYRDARKCHRGDCSRLWFAIVNDPPNRTSLSCATIAKPLGIEKEIERMSGTSGTLAVYDNVTEVVFSPLYCPTT